MNTPTLPEKTTSSKPPKLLDQVVAKIRLKHYCRKTELSYVHWIKRYILFHGKRHPKEMGAPEIEAFLSALVTERNVAANTQNLALSSILFLYREVLEVKLPWLDDIVHAKKPQRLPVVLSRAELKKTDYLYGRNARFDGILVVWNRDAPDGGVNISSKRC